MSINKYNTQSQKKLNYTGMFKYCNKKKSHILCLSGFVKVATFEISRPLKSILVQKVLEPQPACIVHEATKDHDYNRIVCEDISDKSFELSTFHQ